ncbi:hypothetical protein AOV_04880 [Anaplasma ovis str. Haibei]|uniref:Zinc finger CHCC-type domain-containing protein n=1 Tax=Anaplasma ovis str. Haibei TaxID=1248439 RepID=A0A2Z2LCU6_9RICK|nr:zinc-finger domain-containing protein [Anaplasma ovis]ASI48294.1 hypothetical protein AOV_04880 [Anaplasma ovis str. Haibei]
MSGKSCNEEKVTFCDGNDAEGLYPGHPRVYIKITEKKQQCPYCGRVLS